MLLDAIVAILILALLCWFVIRPLSSVALRIAAAGDSIVTELIRRETVLESGGCR